MHPLETYLKDISEIGWTGGAKPETSFYGALENLFNEVGKTLKPRVRCVSQVKDTGAGSPDFGFYSKNQFLKGNDDKPLPGALPERGVVEVKGIKDDSFLTADGKQVTKYWNHYGLILVTNYRDFVLVEKGPDGNSRRLETFRLADSEEEFRQMLAHPRAAAEKKGERLFDYLRRVMLHSAPLDDPEQLAWYLAAYAREAKARIEERAELPGLGALRQALEDSLGLKFEGKEGEIFFRATLVQTLFYGIFSAWVLWAQEQPDKAPRFNWHEAAYKLKVPIIAGLFEQIAMPSKLKPLGLDEVLDWTGDALSRVVRSAFFQKFQQEHAVQYFYEPFLKAYDPKLRKDLGVWYTPPEIVKYQVERVDMVLREELGIADGLADPSVFVLDPCCGTGAYLIEVIKKIHTTLKDSGKGALLGQELKAAALSRVFGFEILPAPFVVAHLQLGLLLSSLGAPLDEKKAERGGVYLTNALTGWDPVEEPKNKLPEQSHIKELLEEKEAASKVKRETPILVILGNPPYNAFAGTSPEEEGGLVDAYKEGLTKSAREGGWGIKKFNMDDLYVRFFRIAERRIVKSGRGVVSFISNYSWTSEPSFVVLRKHLLGSFDKLWIENMHGNRKISEYAPDGRTSETVFAIPGSSPGIQQGIVISLWVRRGEHGKSERKPAKILYRDDLNAARATERRSKLLASLGQDHFDRKYNVAAPTPTNRFSFLSLTVPDEYVSWPMIEELADFKPSLGILENRGDNLISIDLTALDKNMSIYLDPANDWDSLIKLQHPLTKPAARYEPKITREKILAAKGNKQGSYRELLVRPMDRRWCFYSGVRPLWNEPRPSYVNQVWEGNSFIASRRKGVSKNEGPPFNFTATIGAQHSLNTDAYYIPIRLRREPSLPPQNMHYEDWVDNEGNQPKITANLSSTARDYLSKLGINKPDCDASTADLLWMNVLAIGFSPAYLNENADGIRQDWPRIPLPNNRKLLESSAAIGREAASLLEAEKPVSGVTKKPRPEMKPIGVIAHIGGGQLNPDGGDLDLTAGWGHGGKGGVCMPGRGRIEFRPYSSAELAAIAEGAKGLGLTTEQALAALGPDARDVYLNDRAYWSNIPARVWEYYIGGYQVIKKWLSYREKSILGRGMTLEEIHYVSEMTRRLAALCLLTLRLDRNYEEVKTDAYPWPTDETEY